MFNDQNGLLVGQSTNYAWAGIGYSNTLIEGVGAFSGVYTNKDAGGGVGSIIDLGPNYAMTNANLTLSVWCRVAGIPQERSLVGTRHSDLSEGFCFLAGQGGQNWFELFISNGGGGWFRTYQVQSAWRLTQWQNFTCTIDGSYVKTYTNGVYVGQVNNTLAGGKIPLSDKNFFIGGYANRSGCFVGDIGPVSAWSRVLTSGELANIGTNRSFQVTGGLATDVIMHFPLNEGQGMIVTSSVPVVTSGTILSNAVPWRETGTAVVVTGTNTMSLVCTNKIVDFLPTATWMSILAGGSGLTTNDVQGFVSPDYGTNWYQADLTPSTSLDLSNTLFQGTAIYTNNVTSSNMTLKAVTTSNKVVKILGMWGPSN
jgi:hypothetical protein